MSRVLVTGTGGFVGGHVARDLAGRGFEVVGLQRRPAADAGFPVIAADFTAGLGGLPRRVDAIVHIGATSPQPGVTPDRLVRDNIEATRLLVDYAGEAGARSFIFASSMSVYGRIEAEIADETTPRIDPDLYGTTKFVGEKLLEAKADALPSLAIRLPGVLGLGARRNFISETTQRLLRDEPVEAFNPEAPFNNAAHVDDLAAMFARLLERGLAGFDAVTVAAAGMTTIREALLRLRARIGSRSEIRFDEKRRHSFTVSSRRAIELHGYAPMEIDALLDRYADAERGALGR